jgi:hypothetical protein
MLYGLGLVLGVGGALFSLLWDDGGSVDLALGIAGVALMLATCAVAVVRPPEGGTWRYRRR